MTPTTPHHDSLPYIDRPSSPSSLAKAQALITAEMGGASASPHLLVPALPSTISAGMAGTTAPRPLDAISRTRYEVPSWPWAGSSSSSSLSPPRGSSATATATATAAATSALVTLATSSAHLALRLQALALLEAHGRHAWLVGNDALEELLRAYEEELAGLKQEVEHVNRERRRVQEGARARLEGGEQAWRRGVEGLVRVAVGERSAR